MLVGRSAVMQELRVRVARVAKTNFTVLIEGESGAGKELVARELHERSAASAGTVRGGQLRGVGRDAGRSRALRDRGAHGDGRPRATRQVRAGRPGHVVSRRGRGSVADGAGQAPARAAGLSVERVGGQYARQVDVRVVAATNRSLGALVQAGRFRPDLYYRLAGVELHVPPLRARRSDIPLLVDHFVDAASTHAIGSDLDSGRRSTGRVRLAGQRAAARARHRARGRAGPWAVHRDRAISRRRSPRTIESCLGEPVDHDESLRAWSSRYARLVLERCHGNKRRACDVLDISYHTLQAHLDYDIGGRQAFRPPALSAAPDALVPPTVAS